jgi:hypothetical protein
MWSAGQPRGDPRTSGPGFAVTARTLTPAELEVGGFVADGQGAARVLGAPDSLADGQQGGELAQRNSALRCDG